MGDVVITPPFALMQKEQKIKACCSLVTHHVLGS